MQNPNYLLNEQDITNAMNSLGVQDQYIIRSINGQNFDSLEHVLIDRLSQPNPSRFLNIAYNTGASALNASQESGFAKAGHWVAIRLDIQTGQYQIADSLPNQARLQQIQQDMQNLGFPQQEVFLSYNQNDVVSCGAYTALNLLDMQNGLNAPSRSEADNRQYATQIMNYYSNARGAYNQPFPQQSKSQSTQRSTSFSSTSTLQSQGSNALIQQVPYMQPIRNNMIAGGNGNVQVSAFSTENRIFGNNSLQINFLANQNTIRGENITQANIGSSNNRAVGRNKTQINCNTF
jgi:hypothetical protein